MKAVLPRGQFYVRFKDGTKLLLEVLPQWNQQMLMYTVRCTVLDLTLLEGWFIPDMGLRSQDFGVVMMSPKFPKAVEKSIKYRLKKNLLPVLGV